MKNRWCCSLHQSSFSPEFPKKAFFKAFSLQLNSSSLVIHNETLHFFYRSLHEKLFICKNILGGNFVDFVPYIGILTFRYSKWCLSCRYWNSQFFVTRGLLSVIFHIGLCRQLEIYRKLLSNQTIDFFPASESWYSEKSKHAITFDLSWHANPFLTSTTGFLSSTKVSIEKVPLLRSISANNYPFRSLQLPCDSPKKSRSFFKYGVCSISKARFPHIHQLDVLLQIHKLMLPTSVWKPVEEIVEYEPELLESAFTLDTTRYLIFYFFNSIYFFSIKILISIVWYLKQTVRF